MKKIIAIKVLIVLSFAFSAMVHADTPTINQVTGHVQASLINAQVTMLNVGDEKSMQWKFVSAYKEGTLKINLIAEDGLQINSSQRELFFDVKSGSEYGVPATIKALANGRRYLNFYVHYEGAGQQLNGTTSAVFQVGTPMNVNQKPAESNGVTVLKAVEEVKTNQ